jgi:hypothetical protein
MEIIFDIKKVIECKWFIKLDADELLFLEEIKQEMHRNIKEQYGGQKIW